MIAVNRDAKSVVLDNGVTVGYDQLVIATGSRPASIPAGNQCLKNIYSFRTLEDVDRISAVATQCLAAQCGQSTAPALVIGGGLLGLEAAYGLARRGIKVTLVHRGTWLLNRQLDEISGCMLRSVMEEKNVEFELGTEVAEFVGEDSLRGAWLTNGRLVDCQLAVVATGITPNKELGIEAGLAGDRGILVDDFMCTHDSHISAIGECIEHQGVTYGLVDPIWQQCLTLAERLCYGHLRPFRNRPVATKLKVSGVQLFSAGAHVTGDNHRELALADPEVGIYRKLLLENNRIVGIVLFGDVRHGQDYFAMMEEGKDVSELVPTLLFGKAFLDADASSIAA